MLATAMKTLQICFVVAAGKGGVTEEWAGEEEVVVWCGAGSGACGRAHVSTDRAGWSSNSTTSSNAAHNRHCLDGTTCSGYHLPSYSNPFLRNSPDKSFRLLPPSLTNRILSLFLTWRNVHLPRDYQELMHKFVGVGALGSTWVIG